MRYSIIFALIFLALAVWEFRRLGAVAATAEDGSKRRLINVIRFGQLVFYPAIGWYVARYIED